jgi:hypothetical protein
MSKLNLKSTTSGGDKESYTEGEKNLAHICVSTVLLMGEITCPKPKYDPVVTSKLEEVKEGHNGVDTLTRDLFRSMIRSVCKSGKEFAATKDFPKEREPTSIQLLMREGMERCGRSDLKDQVFARYGAKKKA